MVAHSRDNQRKPLSAMGYDNRNIMELLLLIRQLNYGVSIMQPPDTFITIVLCLTFARHATRPFSTRVLEWLVALVLYASSAGFVGSLEFVTDPPLKLAAAMFFLAIWYFVTPAFMSFHGCYDNGPDRSVKTTMVWWGVYTPAFFFVFLFLTALALSANSDSAVARSYSYAEMSLVVALFIYVATRNIR